MRVIAPGGRQGITSVGHGQLKQGNALIGAIASACAMPVPISLGRTARFRPLGIALDVETDEPELLTAVATACHGWEDDVDPAARRLHLTLMVGQRVCRAGEPLIEVDGLNLRIMGGGVEARADAARGTACCMVSADLLRDEAALRQDVLDPLILFLVTRSGRAPIHAAGLLAGDLAILLAGPAGAGKSCLALAAHRAGFELLSDDTVYVSVTPGLRVRGIPRPIHLFPDDAASSGGGAARLRNGKLKQAIAVRPARHAPLASRAVFCVLDFGPEVALTRIDQAEALRRCGPLEAGFDLLRGPIETALAALTRNGAWRLTLSPRPAEAIALLADSLLALGAGDPA